jgi:lipopolysaccharide biosynthesis glycosyltransferase
VSVLHVGCAVEAGYVPHSAAMLDSVLQHSGSMDVHVHYMHGRGLPAGSRERLSEMVEGRGGGISFVEAPDDLCAGLPTAGFTREATWYRVFAPNLLPNLDRVLFLDADLVAMDSLETLWNTDVSDSYLAAVTNVFEADHLARPLQIGLERPEEYFNAGVMLMNLELLRRDGCVERMRTYGAEHAHELHFRDQDALNAVLAKRRWELHPRWNVMNSFYAYEWGAHAFGYAALEEAKRNPGIRHYEGPDLNKPWHRRYWFPHGEPYFEHRRSTPWPEVRMVGRRRPLRSIAGRLLRAARALGS